MTASINASTTAGVVVTSDTSGSLALQTAGTTAVTLDTNQNVLVGMSSYGVTNAGVSLSPTASSSFYVAGGTALTIGRGVSDGTAVQFNRSGTNCGTIAVTTTSLAINSVGNLLLGSNNTTNATLDTSGNLGLGVTPSAWSGVKAFEIAGLGSALVSGGNNDIELVSNAYYNGSWKYAATGAAAHYYQASGVHYWRIAGSGSTGGTVSFTQAMTLDNSGNLLVGTTSANGYKLNVQAGGSGAVTCFDLGAGNIDIVGGALATNVGYIGMGGSHSLAFTRSGTTESMRIDTSGNLLVGCTAAASYTPRISLSTDSGTTKWAVGPGSSTATSFFVAANATYGVYLSSTTSTSWSSASDERLKTDLQPIENAAEKVCSLRAVTGRYTADDSGVRKSFLIAQDVLAVLPEAVDTSNPARFGLAYTDTIPLLVAAIKELNTLVTAQAAQITALNAKVGITS